MLPKPVVLPNSVVSDAVLVSPQLAGTWFAGTVPVKFAVELKGMATVPTLGFEQVDEYAVGWLLV